MIFGNFLIICFRLESLRNANRLLSILLLDFINTIQVKKIFIFHHFLCLNFFFLRFILIFSQGFTTNRPQPEIVVFHFRLKVFYLKMESSNFGTGNNFQFARCSFFSFFYSKFMPKFFSFSFFLFLFGRGAERGEERRGREREEKLSLKN